jgi:phosphinothricin acetyltransferase
LIRPAGEQDLESIVRIWREGVSQAIGESASVPEEQQLKGFFLQRIRAAKPPFGFWVACCERDSVIGWQALLPFDNNPVTCSFVAEWSIYVARSHARRGVGEALTRHAMKSASEGPLQYVIGIISAENRGALALAEKCGWVRVGALPGTEKGPGRPEVRIVAFVPAALRTGSTE